ncbi:type II toxin-antitoxin system prevent-host-death family antitoxin [Actinomadura darangshiensis]|uniref:Type II toxin-antitoxin system prevent-host-death family antitoxin n=1 Tax=Actinomadura darangshiensis TaxID=705336 RepID=A0A4R5BVA7_9ACTN|nr:type II toxin-antitoxin system prevent-host-death family antitoxin [Actinomadura darangshiensis]TDD91068.1 type II toxin-antitoxin system prevent-host-death family antitoxin [Actinomadura darangshiensis]
MIDEYTGDDETQQGLREFIESLVAWPEAVRRWGEPLNVENARRDWFRILDRILKAGEITLIARDRAGTGWAAVIPVTEVIEPLDELHAWGSSEARPKLGDVVRAAAGYSPDSGPQLITIHRKPAAAVVSVRYILGRPMGEDRLDLAKLLRTGGRAILEFSPGTTDDNVPGVPGDPKGFIVTVLNPAGEQVGFGGGYTIQEAMANVSPTAPS